MMMITPRSSHVAKRRRDDMNKNQSSTFIGVSLHSTDSVVFEDSDAGDSLSGSYGSKPKTIRHSEHYIDHKITNTYRLPPGRKSSQGNDNAWFTLSGSSVGELSRKKLEKKSVPTVLAVNDYSPPEMQQRQEQTSSSPRRKTREFPSKFDNHDRITTSKALDQRKRQVEQHQNLSEMEKEARERESALIRKLQNMNDNRSDDKGMQTTLSKKRPLHKEDNNADTTNDMGSEQRTISTVSLSATIDTEPNSAASSMTSTEVAVRRRAEAWEQKIRTIASRDSNVVKSYNPPKPRNSLQSKTIAHSKNIPKFLQLPKSEVVDTTISPRIRDKSDQRRKCNQDVYVTRKSTSPKIEVVDREVSPQILYEMDGEDIAHSECSEDADYVPKYLQSPKKAVHDRIPPAFLFESDQEETESSESSYEDVYETPESLRSQKVVDYNRLPGILFASDREETEYTEADSEFHVIEASKGQKEQRTISPRKKRTRKIPAKIVIHTEDDTSTTCESTHTKSQHSASDDTEEEKEDETEVSKSFIVSLKGFADSDYEPRPTMNQTRKSMLDMSLRLEKNDSPPAKPIRRQLVPYPPAIQQDLESGVLNDDSDDDEPMESVKSDHFGDFALWRSAELANDAKRAGRRTKQRMVAVSIILMIAFGLILFVIVDPLQRWDQR